MDGAPDNHVQTQSLSCRISISESEVFSGLNASNTEQTERFFQNYTNLWHCCIVTEYKSYRSASYTIGWYLADMTTWPITCGLTYLSFRGKIRPPSWLQKRIQPFILKYPALSNTIKSRPMLAASILTVTTPINRLFLPFHIWIMIKYGNDIMKNLEKNPQVFFYFGPSRS